MCDPELASGDILFKNFNKRKKPRIAARLFDFKIGIDILSRALGQVPSAQAGLTSLFGMGRGDPRRNRHHKGIEMMNDKFWMLNEVHLTFSI